MAKKQIAKTEKSYNIITPPTLGEVFIYRADYTTSSNKRLKSYHLPDPSLAFFLDFNGSKPSKELSNNIIIAAKEAAQTERYHNTKIVFEQTSPGSNTYKLIITNNPLTRQGFYERIENVCKEAGFGVSYSTLTEDDKKFIVEELPKLLIAEHKQSIKLPKIR